ncbi:DNA-binding transcriptional regulator, MerR family [Dethiosulfatibacter aminovorans DSM 17477]|uniref:DNA-binding transcriptional regulator, MerR family n=1 Tax=Dethiosulfatibacter aminovorans DSM 17477 TaxID=1121476 RepID=A0A1M6BU01_9FIRM|nr:MerR family transcriptional regulator [Dethiosulfatibacter aminovorans]SHI52073.1 DNA-binding transcriptional regulator, MerR family [Dethiosulfatibacter aminovorans DSM 17477]
MNRLKIGEMAKVNKVTIQTLRHYDNIGLLKPSMVDEDTGYRYYHINQSAKLDLINYMKLLGMSLDQIKKLFEKNDIELIVENLNRQLKWIEENKKKLEIMERGAMRFKENLGEYERTLEDESVRIIEFSERRIFCYDSGMNIYEKGIETYEYMLRELKNQVQLNNLPMIYFHNVGSIIRKKNIKARNYKSTEIFVFVDNDYSREEGFESVMEGKYACICFKGEEGFENELYYAEKLLDHVSGNGYEIVGDYLCEVITELPVFDENSRGMYIRLQVPIR